MTKAREARARALALTLTLARETLAREVEPRRSLTPWRGERRGGERESAGKSEAVHFQDRLAAKDWTLVAEGCNENQGVRVWAKQMDRPS